MEGTVEGWGREGGGGDEHVQSSANGQTASHQSREQSLSYLSEAGGSHSCLGLSDWGLGSPLLLCLPRVCCLHVP